MTAEHLKQTLRQLPLGGLEVILESGPGRLVAAVISPDFRAVKEAARQEQVWEHLTRAYAEAALVDIEMVFTYTPEELAAVERGEPLEA